MKGVMMLRRAAVAIELEGMFQQAVKGGFKGDREAFVAVGLHQVSQNMAASQTRWNAACELIEWRAKHKA